MRKFFVPSDKEGHYRFDLEGYAAHRLEQAGIARTETLGICTYPADNGFFSFRRATHPGEPDYGRQISAIVLTGSNSARRGRLRLRWPAAKSPSSKLHWA